MNGNFPIVGFGKMRQRDFLCRNVEKTLLQTIKFTK